MRPSSNPSRVFLLAVLCCGAGAALFAQTASRPSATSPLQNAANELAAGKLDQADRDLQSVLRSDPGDYRALDLLGVVRVLQHQNAKAEALFQQVVKARPAFAPGHAHLGLLYLQLGRAQDAVPELQQALRLDPSRTDVADALVHILRLQASAASDAGDWNAALSDLIEARKAAPNNADVQYEFAMVAHKLSLDDDAIEAFQETLKLRRNDAAALYNLGFALMDRGRFDDARQQFAQYLEVRPDDASGHCALGMALAALDRSDEARAQFQRSVSLDSAQSESYYRLGLLDLDAGDYDAAARDLHQALDHKPNDAGALTALGRVEFEQKHYPEAIAALQQAVSQDDALGEAHYYLGLTLARMGRKPESDEQLAIAARLEQEQKEHSRTLLRLRKPDDGGQPAPNPPQ